MRNLLNPKWLLLINTLPIIALTILLYSQFNIIKSILDDYSIVVWENFVVALVIIALLNLAYTLYAIRKKMHVSIWYSIISIVVYISYIYLHTYHLDVMLPTDLPRWMTFENSFIYVGTFLMPTLIYALFVLIVNLTPQNKNHKAWVNFLIAIAIPVSGYVFGQVILPLWQPAQDDYLIHSLLILTIVATLLFLFFLVRGLFILANKKAKSWARYQLFWKVPIALILPIFGLLLNNEFFDSFMFNIGDRIFGDFTSVWFFVLAVINGVLICLPSFENKSYRLILFFARSITLAYTLYFFLVFLPFLPFSLFAIIAFGLGFLMLTPLLLFIIHINELSKDFNYLKQKFSKSLLYTTSILGFLIIPSILTINFWQDKMVLNDTLAYIYNPDYDKSYDIDTTSLRKTLQIIHKHKSNRNIFANKIFNGLPYISSYYNWLVLDNLTLSDNKLNKIGQIFFGIENNDFNIEIDRENKVEISNITTESNYDLSQKAWRSWINLEITNYSDDGFEEYATTLNLPTGTWISDYYLYVGDKKEPGILAEKKAAMWIYSQIRNENKDPGILYYMNGNKVAFKVFPFDKNEVRNTGIELLHKDAIEINLDGNLIKLGDSITTKHKPYETDNIIYISAKQKESLETVKRQPYFHFLIDISENKKEQSNDFINRVEQALTINPQLANNTKISFVNSQVTSMPLQSNWKEEFKQQRYEGGYYLDRAIKKALIDNYKNHSQNYPVLVAVTDSMQYAILDTDYSDLQFTYPESDRFYHLDTNANLLEHSLTKQPSTQQPQVKRDCEFCETVVAYPISDSSFAYLPKNHEPSIILKNETFDLPEKEIKEKNWESGLNMQGKRISHILHPEKANTDWYSMVKYSFISKIMTPHTSYIVVENEAQKAMLKKKQEEILSGNKNLDPGEEVIRMSEPSWIIIMVIFALFIFYRENKRRPQCLE